MLDPSAPFDLMVAVQAGYVFTADGSAVHCVGPDGRHGYGPTPDDACKNIGAQIIPSPFGRILIRETGETVYLDAALAPAQEVIATVGLTLDSPLDFEPVYPTAQPTDDQRAPDDEQPLALAVAEEAGVLPETDRRAE